MERLMLPGLLATVLLATIASGCTSYTTLPASTRAAVAAGQRGREVALRTSCYYGRLYDDNRYLLLAPWPFAHTSHIFDLDQRPIYPDDQRGIIPAGTRFAVVDVEFPDESAVPRRMLRSPRFSTWLILRLAPHGDPFLPADAPPFVLVLPEGQTTGAAVEQTIAAFVGEPAEVASWLAARSPEVAVAIRHKEALIGMTGDELFAALGYPLLVQTVVEGERRSDLADYGFRRIRLEGGRVSELLAAAAPVPPTTAVSPTAPPPADQNQRPAPAP